MDEFWYFVVVAGIGVMGAGVFIFVVGLVAALLMSLEDEA